jgi:succinate dehydrogenase / fumarate reductase flavoprotein subunit
MRGGQYVNNWRMAELHAREAPDRVRELEAWGAVFDRTQDGRILQRNFGGHKYPRLAHVGDRTGLEMIRTLQDHGIHKGIDVHMECTVTALLKDGDRIAGAFGYDRERGRFRVFKARAIVLATGGIGRAYRITSNSWEYTGDGHSLAYHAGAELIDMEFIQFHPTGMVWPPSVRGILVTEGVRGEGGILTNTAGKRFMFDDIPDNYKSQTADNEEEGWRYVTGDKSARRPPELLTRDHVSRCIVREIKEGRGTEHGGVFLDISWIKKHIPNAPEHIRRKLPSMYHQFKELAGIDITAQPMEVGPTTHYIMGGVRVDSDSQMSRVPGLFAAGECAAGINGANRLGATRSPTCWCSASAPASMPPAMRARRGRVPGRWRTRRWTRRRAARSSRSSGRDRGRGRSTCSAICRGPCRTWSASCGARTRWPGPSRRSGPSRSAPGA